MNESRLRSNKSNPEDRMTKEVLKELKVTIYTYKVHIFFLQWLDHIY